MKMSNIKLSGDLDAEVVQREAIAAISLEGPKDPPSNAMIETHNMTHLPAAPWYEICSSLWEKRLAHWSQVRYRDAVRATGFSVHFWYWCLVSRGTGQGNCADDG